MATRENTFLLKRSNIPNKVPTIGQLNLGELALNTADSKLYTEYTGGATGATEVREIGWNRVNITGDTMTGELIAPSFSATTFTGGSFVGDGSGLTGIDDFYITGGTYTAGILTLTRNDAVDVVINDLPTPSPYKTFRLTGGTSYTFTDFTTVNTLSVNKATGSNTTVILNQTPSVDEFYVVKDSKGDSVTNPITVSGGTYNIDGNASIQIKQNNKPSFTFLFDGTEYIII